MKTLLRLAGLACVYPFTCGFVLLDEQGATLPTAPSTPTVMFNWDGQTPTSITDKQLYGDGTYGGLDDTDMMKQLITDAMGLWNNVPGSFVKLEYQEGATADDSSDQVNSIMVKHDPNISSAAYAFPNFDPNNPHAIYDCDVHIANTSVAASDLGFILAHELGHCLGLGHAHTNYGAIMGYSRADRSMTLGDDDRAGIIYLYPDPAVWDGKVKELACGAVGAGAGGGGALAAAPRCSG